MADRIKKLLLQLPSFMNSVSHTELANANVITVKRSHARQYQVEAVPTGSEANVYHDVAGGRLIWSAERPGNGTFVELIHVLYTGGGFDIIDVPVVDIPVPPDEPVPDPGPPGAFSGPFKLSHSTLLICDEVETTLYFTGYVNPGSVMYTDLALTIPVTGSKFLLDVYTNVLYDLGLSDGVVGSVIGSC